MSEPCVLLDVDKCGVATATLNRPAVNNAYNGEIVQSLLDGCEKLAGDAAVRVVVIRGNGRHFQAGADLNWLKEISHMDAAANLEMSRRYALSCERFSAEQAQAMGLVHEVCETGALDDALRPVLESLLHAAPTSVRESKLSAMRCSGSIMSDAEFERLVAQHASKRQSDEAKEGLTSFLEKRDPSWYPAA